MTGTARRIIAALEAALAASEARVSAAEAQITSLALMIEKLRRALYGQRSERNERLLDQLELVLDDLPADASEHDLAAEKAASQTTEVSGFVRRKPSRKPFPDHLPRERVVVPGPVSCACCGSERQSKIAEAALAHVLEERVTVWASSLEPAMRSSRTLASLAVTVPAGE